MKDFQSDSLRSMVAVGAVGPRNVKLWMRSEYPGTLQLQWWPDNAGQSVSEADIRIPKTNARDNTCVIQVPDDFPQLAPLLPDCRYQFRVIHKSSNQLVGQGRFETAPAHQEAAPSRYAIALMSCHQPFDNDGLPVRQSDQMLRAAYHCLGAHNTKLVLTVGDQIYADSPPSLSLFDDTYFATVAPRGRSCLQACTAEEVRELYQQRYRQFWGLSAWQAIHANYPCYPILDDHEIVDNWGSKSAHQTSEWRAIGDGARLAYLDYQGSRVLPVGERLPESFHYPITYGNMGVFVMDLRSERQGGAAGQLFSKEQETALQHFLQEHREKPCLSIVLSVPVLHFPQWIVQTAGQFTPWSEDFRDRWAAKSHCRDRDWLLNLLYQHQQRHPAQRLVLLSGDIHIGCVHEIRWRPNGPALYQLTSSGITNHTDFFMRHASTFSIRLNRRVRLDDGVRAKVRLLPGMGQRRQNPYGRLNIGILEIETPTPDATPILRFFIYGHHQGSPVCVYQSPPI